MHQEFPILIKDFFKMKSKTITNLDLNCFYLVLKLGKVAKV